MSKEKPILHRSDLIESFDRHKLGIYDLIGIANTKDCSISIHIRQDGYVSFEMSETCGNKTYYKEITQSEKSLSYKEMEIKD